MAQDPRVRGLLGIHARGQPLALDFTLLSNDRGLSYDLHFLLGQMVARVVPRRQRYLPNGLLAVFANNFRALYTEVSPTRRALRPHELPDPREDALQRPTPFHDMVQIQRLREDNRRFQKLPRNRRHGPPKHHRHQLPIILHSPFRDSIRHVNHASAHKYHGWDPSLLGCFQRPILPHGKRVFFLEKQNHT